jgi:hypothetical protein
MRSLALQGQCPRWRFGLVWGVERMWRPPRWHFELVLRGIGQQENGQGDEKVRLQEHGDHEQ